MSRWIELYATSPSGKTLFMCKMCGRQSPVPTTSCYAPPATVHKAPLPCELLEEIQEAAEEAETGEVASGLKYFDVAMTTRPGSKESKISVSWRDKDNKWHTAMGLLSPEVVSEVNKQQAREGVEEESTDE